MKKKIKIPKFADENQERRFWGCVKLSEYFSPADFALVSFPDLKPSSRSIAALRIPEFLLVQVKERANELNVPYQSLIKEYIARGVLPKR